MTQYLCDVCKETFNHENTFFTHFENEHLCTSNYDKSDSIIKKLKKEFPMCEFDLEEVNEWYALKTFHIHYKGCDIIEHYGKNDLHIKNPSSFEELAFSIKQLITIVDDLTTKISSIGNFDELTFTGFSRGYSLDEDSFTIKFKVNGDNKYHCTEYYPWGDITEEQFLNQFKQYFLTEIEGKLGSIYDRGHFVSHTIDNIPIDNILNSDKRIRISIVE